MQSHLDPVANRSRPTWSAAGAYGIEHVVSSYSRTEGGFRVSLLGREGDYDSMDVLESSRVLEDYSTQSDKPIELNGRICMNHVIQLGPQRGQG